MPDQPTSRRDFLRTSLGMSVGATFLAASGCDTSDPLPASPTPQPSDAPDLLSALGLDAEDFVLHGENPITAEAQRFTQTGHITPTSRFFIRNNLPMPDPSILEDRDSWALTVEGVAKPGAVTLRQLKGMGLATVATVLQCSGNGRAFYEHGPSGSQWGVGAAGCALWTGVPVRTVLQALGGVLDGMAYLTSLGGDPLPEGVAPDEVKVERSIPLARALEHALLAWEMNGEPIPLTHGGPLRLIVPGFYGCNQIKYIRRMACTAEQTTARIQRSGYRLRPIGEKGNPSQPSMWQMNVKSWLTGPGADGPVLAGPQVFRGVAFSGGAPVQSVAYSIDGGHTWQEAELIGPDLGPWAWRSFAFTADLGIGTHTLFTRATDTTGAVQPEQRVENERGYGNNSWRDMGLTLEVVAELPDRAPSDAVPAAVAPTTPVPAAPSGRALDAQGERGKALFLGDATPACGTCHTLGDAGTQAVVGPSLDMLAPDAARVERAVTGGIGVMPPYKDRLTPEQISDLAHYVSLATKKP